MGLMLNWFYMMIMIIPTDKLKGYFSVYLIFLDSLLTIYGVKIGFSELNPIISYLIDTYGSFMALMIKIIIGSICCYFIYMKNISINTKKIKYKNMRLLIYSLRNIVLISYMSVVLYNIMVVFLWTGWHDIFFI